MPKMSDREQRELFDSDQIRTVKMIVDPELARKWFARNSKSNRHINPTRVDLYARDMEVKEFHFNGESIKFSKGGALIDGQHRLLACIQANTPFETNVVFGLDEDAILTVDNNMIRTTAQMLKMTKGTVNAGTVSGAISWLWKYQQNQLTTGRAPSRHEAMALLSANPGIEMSVKKIKHVGFAAPAILAFCHYTFSRQDQLLADSFFDALETGENMKGGDPVFLLRERLIQNRMNRSKLPMIEVLALMFKAWQATKEGKPLKLLRYAVNEDFPTIEDDLKTGTMWRGKARAKFIKSNGMEVVSERVQ